MKSARELLGCQLWVEPADSPDRIESLVARAAECGFGWLRIFLMWNWIEDTPGVWDFKVFDLVFAAAQRHEIRIKATLTANSGPWHVGTPSMLHSHTGFLSPDQRAPMRIYIQKCVERYQQHPALGQWILWNEPNGGHERTDEVRQHWQTWLHTAYGGDLAALNRRWGTGYTRFAEIPFPEAIRHPVQMQAQHWNSYAPWLADWQSRAAWLNSELRWIKSIVREFDSVTEICVNPTEVLSNRSLGGTDLDAMGDIVDVMGASYHPAWQFTFANPADFPALMAAGIRLQASHPSIKRVEVTEVQVGNTLNSSNRPSDAKPDEIARFFIASLAAGAESVTGWCLNARSVDFEAGDWGLLDDTDEHSPRSRMIKRLHDRLEICMAKAGAWHPAEARLRVVSDPSAQALDWIEQHGSRVLGRLPHDGAYGASLLAAHGMRLGISTSLTTLRDVPHSPRPGDLLIVSQIAAWTLDDAERLLTFARAGGTVLLDGTSGRKTPDAKLHRPWPGGLAASTGFRSLGLQTQPDGYDLNLWTMPAGRSLLTRVNAEISSDWQAWPELRFAQDGEPCVWERPFGAGRLVVFRGMLGPSLVHLPDFSPVVRFILSKLFAGSQALAETLVPVAGHPSTIVIPVSVERGRLWAVLAPSQLARAGQLVHLAVPQGSYYDLWSEQALARNASGELTLIIPDGIALIWSDSPLV